MAIQHTMDTGTANSGVAKDPRDPVKLTTDEARQGVTGFGVRYVLAISLGAALVSLAAAWVLIAH